MEIIIWLVQYMNLSTDKPIFVENLEKSSSSIYKKNLAFFGRARTRTRIAESRDQHSSIELSDRLMKDLDFNQYLYLNSSIVVK